MVKEPAMVRLPVPDRTQCGEHPVPCLRTANEAAVLGDADGCQSETGGGDARQRVVIAISYIRAVFGETSERICLLPEKPEVCVFEIVQESILVRRKPALRRF